MMINDALSQIEDAAAALLSSIDVDPIPVPIIEEKVRAVANIQGNYSNEDIDLITKKLQERFNIGMSLGTIFSSEEYRPWLNDARESIEWYYWNRYKRYLNNQKFPNRVIRGLDSITDQVIDHLENPKKTGQWERKGMVVGHVQSGKTLNYTGLINKAADCGYKVIIVLAGMLNSLRNQTQFRLDSGFIGKDTEEKSLIGVGQIEKTKSPVFFTTNANDFKKAIANQIGVGIEDLKEPVILVIKKHKNTLENLIDWLRHNNPHNLQNNPMLLVDDEADHASINTNPEGDIATTINRKIRELLALFDRSSYVGYTATPFANVFIDPETDENSDKDLFPKDFIISLDPPDNYVGSVNIFSSDKDLDIVRIVRDYSEHLPIKHKIDWRPEKIPESLKEAVIVFVLSRAIRILRGQEKSHNSMLVNVSRFTAVQSAVKLLVDEYLKEIRQAIINNYKLDFKEAMNDSIFKKLKNIYDKEFNSAENNWSNIQNLLKKAVSPVSVIEVNSSSYAEPLDYSSKNYPNGRNVIAIGGLSLSRGLTLEGLTISYFLRNSVMYDTLMQMGRWFGYRDGFVDLCRIYMTAEAESWYAHISDVIEELRDEFKRMKAQNMTPKDFGLCVQCHPESLIVTARNKMRSGRRVTRKVSLEGRLVETSILMNTKTALEGNRKLLSQTIQKMLKIKNPVTKENNDNQYSIPSGFLWKDIPVDIIYSFIKNFINHRASELTNHIPLKKYIELLQEEGLNKWDVIIISPDTKKIKPKVYHGLEVQMQKRGVAKFGDNGLAVNKQKRRVGYAIQESAGIPSITVNKEKKDYLNTKNVSSISGVLFRKIREKYRLNPLLILHLLNCEEIDGAPLFEDGAVAYGISFPGEAGSRRPKKIVEYVVNTTWWKNEFLDQLDEEDGNYEI